MDNNDDFLEIFRQEAQEHLDNLEKDLLELENGSGEQGVIDRIFRAVHSIKGAAGFFGLETIAKLSHVMENLMALVRDGKMATSKEIVDGLLAGSDKLRIMVDDVDNSMTVDVSKEIETLKGLLEGKKGDQPKGEKKKKAEPKKTEPVPDFLEGFRPEYYLVEDGIREEHNFYVVTFKLHGDVEAKGRELLKYLKEIEPLGIFIDFHLKTEEVKGLMNALEVDMKCAVLMSTKMQEDLIAGVFDVEREFLKELPRDKAEGWLWELSQKKEAEEREAEEEVEEKVMVVEEKSPKAQKTASRKGDETIRISVALLDDLMNLAGELVLGRNQLLRISEDMHEHVDGMDSILQNINLVTSEMQEKVMQTRLQPIGGLFGKFTRIVRDLGKKLGKEVDLKLVGEEVELDKSIVEALSDPLTHIIRNCMDHGIESPKVREERGKNRTGTVVMTAKHVAGQVHIEIVDDGGGVDPERVKKKALEKGVIGEEEAMGMSDRQLVNLIFAPGFSTAEQVSDVSGRGVGMDVVKTNIEKLGGNVELESEKGKGTRLCLRLPLTLAIVPAIIIGADRGKRFAIPQVNVEEIVKLGKTNRVEYVRENMVLRLREKLLPLVNLEKQISADVDADDLEEKGYVLVLRIENNRFGLIVREIYDHEEIVVKPLGKYLKKTRCYAGATIMGDGKVAMILDVAGIAELATLNFDEIKEAKDKEKGIQSKGESQFLLLFRNTERELFSINLAMVSRIEKIKSSEIEVVGDKEYLKQGSHSLRLLRLHDYVNIKRSSEDPEYLYIIIPRLIKNPMGIIGAQLEDIVETKVTVDEESVKGEGILGSGIINDQLTLFLDIYGIFEKADPEHHKRPEKAKNLAGKRILLAEDTAFFRVTVGQYLKDTKCHVDIVNHGQEAWERLHQEDYDLLLTDIEMPIMDGYELTSKVKGEKRFEGMPVIALTSLSSDQHRQKGREVGFDAYEVKLDKETLQATIRGFLEK